VWSSRSPRPHSGWPSTFHQTIEATANEDPSSLSRVPGHLLEFQACTEIRQETGLAPPSGLADDSRDAAGIMGTPTGRPERPAVEGGRPRMGRNGDGQRDDRAAGLRPRGDRPVQCGRHQGRRRWAALHDCARPVPGSGPLRPERGGEYPSPVPRRAAVGSPAEALHEHRVPRRHSHPRPGMEPARWPSSFRGAAHTGATSAT